MAIDVRAFGWHATIFRARSLLLASLTLAVVAAVILKFFGARVGSQTDPLPVQSQISFGQMRLAANAAASDAMKDVGDKNAGESISYERQHIREDDLQPDLPPAGAFHSLGIGLVGTTGFEPATP